MKVGKYTKARSFWPGTVEEEAVCCRNGRRLSGINNTSPNNHDWRTVLFHFWLSLGWPEEQTILFTSRPLVSSAPFNGGRKWKISNHVTSLVNVYFFFWPIEMFKGLSRKEQETVNIHRIMAISRNQFSQSTTKCEINERLTVTWKPRFFAGRSCAKSSSLEDLAWQQQHDNWQDEPWWTCSGTGCSVAGVAITTMNGHMSTVCLPCKWKVSHFF